MSGRLIQHGTATLLTLGVLHCSPALAQDDGDTSTAPETESTEVTRSQLSALRDLLTQSHDQESPDVERSDFSLGPQRRSTSDKRTIGAPLRKRKGGLWSLDESWSFGLGLMRAGEPRPESSSSTLRVKESMWLDVAGTDGSVHMLDASLNWSIDPLDDIKVSFEGGLRTLAQSEPTPAQSIDQSAIDLDGSLITQPVMGAAVRWSLTDWAYIEGSAIGNVIDDAGSFLDVTAQAGIDLTARTGLVAGYRYLDASFDSAGNSATLNQDALFAGLRIRY